MHLIRIHYSHTSYVDTCADPAFIRPAYMVPTATRKIGKSMNLGYPWETPGKRLALIKSEKYREITRKIANSCQNLCSL